MGNWATWAILIYNAKRHCALLKFYSAIRSARISQFAVQILRNESQAGSPWFTGIRFWSVNRKSALLSSVSPTKSNDSVAIMHKEATCRHNARYWTNPMLQTDETQVTIVALLIRFEQIQ